MMNSIALGTFDGVHKGHKKVLELPTGTKRIAIIFKQSPKSIITGKKEFLMTYIQKVEAIKEVGIDEVVALDFNEVKNISANDFLDLILKKYNPSFISCGFNYKFGKNAEGDTELLKKFCDNNKIALLKREPIKSNGQVISSSLIREYLKKGDIEKANSLLTTDFSFSEKIIYGNQRGRTIGFPTINQKYPEELVKLKFGVYKTKIKVIDKLYNGITNIGMRPTYLSDYVISETYIEDFSGDLYGKEITTIPVKFIREEVKFSSIEELKKQIQKDLNS